MLTSPYYSSSPLIVPWGEGATSHSLFSPLYDSSQSIANFCHSPHCRLFTYARLSLHLNLVLYLPLLQPSIVLYALFVNLSPHIPCTFSAHCSLFRTTFILRCFFVPISSLSSAIFLLCSHLTLRILQIQLFYVTYF